MARRCLNAQHDLYIAGVKVASWNPPRSSGYPRIEIDPAKGVGGWHSTPDADDAQADTPAGRRGESPYPRTSRGKTITYNLIAKELTEPGLLDLLDYHRAVFTDRSSLGFLIVTDWPGLPYANGEQWATFARVLEFDADELQTRGPTAVPSPWQRDALLSFRQLDGRWLWWNEQGTPGDQKSYTDVTAVEVTNAGTAPVEPSVTVTGVAAGDDVHIGRDLPGGGSVSLWFRQPGAGDLVIDFTNHTAKIGSTDVSDSYDASSSQWWDEFTEGIPPGGPHNIWRGPGAGTGITVAFFSASW